MTLTLREKEEGIVTRALSLSNTYSPSLPPSFGGVGRFSRNDSLREKRPTPPKWSAYASQRPRCALANCCEVAAKMMMIVPAVFPALLIGLWSDKSVRGIHPWTKSKDSSPQGANLPMSPRSHTPQITQAPGKHTRSRPPLPSPRHQPRCDLHPPPPYSLHDHPDCHVCLDACLARSDSGPGAPNWGDSSLMRQPAGPFEIRGVTTTPKS